MLSNSESTQNRRARRPLVRALRLVTLALVALLGLAALDVAVTYGRVQRVEIAHPPDRPGTTFLLIGDDAREGVDPDRFGSARKVPGHRADVAVVIHLPDEGPPAVLALPRDLMVFTDNAIPRRLNVTMLDGPQGTVDSLCRSLGIAVDHVAIIGLRGFTSIVDRLGGIEVNVDTPVRDTVTGLHLAAAGRHRLSGDDALAFVRSRHAESFDGTAWRAVPAPSQTRPTQSRQALAGLVAAVTPLRPDRLQRAAWATAGAVTLDQRTGVRDLARLAGALRRSNADGADLPAVTVEAQVPIAVLEPGAPAALAAVGVDVDAATTPGAMRTGARSTRPGGGRPCSPGLLEARRPA